VGYGEDMDAGDDDGGAAVPATGTPVEDARGVHQFVLPAQGYQVYGAVPRQSQPLQAHAFAGFQGQQQVQARMWGASHPQQQGWQAAAAGKGAPDELQMWRALVTRHAMQLVAAAHLNAEATGTERIQKKARIAARKELKGASGMSRGQRAKMYRRLYKNYEVPTLEDDGSRSKEGGEQSGSESGSDSESESRKGSSGSSNDSSGSSSDSDSDKKKRKKGGKKESAKKQAKASRRAKRKLEKLEKNAVPYKRFKAGKQAVKDKHKPAEEERAEKFAAQ